MYPVKIQELTPFFHGILVLRDTVILSRNEVEAKNLRVAAYTRFFVATLLRMTLLKITWTGY
jgi:hypothetical protein